MSNFKKFLQGGAVGIFILFFFLMLQNILLPVAASYPWNCTPGEGGFNFLNTTASNKQVRCIEYTNCLCPGSPPGKCGEGRNIVWQKNYAPGESGFCTFSISHIALASCKIHQVDLMIYDNDHDHWNDVPNCWFIVNKCLDCLTPTPSPTPIGSPTPTPTPTTPTTPSPTPTLGASPTPTPTVPILTPTPTYPVTPTPTPTSPVVTPTPTATPTTPTGTLTPTPTPTEGPTPPPGRGCWQVCGHSSECSGGLTCEQAGETKRCLNTACPQEQDCDCAAPTPPPVLGEEAPPVLPKAGFSLSSLTTVTVFLILLRFLILRI